MPSKRSRPPGLSDGKDVTPETKRTQTPSSARPPASKGVRKSVNTTPSKVTAKPTSLTKPVPKPAQNRLKVGVDFGTTNSGVAYVMSLKSDTQDVEVIKNWPGGVRLNEQLEKVPSRIAFKSENADMDEDKWGYEVPPGSQSYTWFKLLLDADADKTSFDCDKLAGKMESGLLDLPVDMTAEEVAAAYLSKLYRHTMEVLEKRYTAKILKPIPVDFWFTVPATWQESAVDATRTAAEKAGFGSRKDDQLSVISEPEAAAIATFSSAIENLPEIIMVRGRGLGSSLPYRSNVVKAQMNVIICDLGGGTLDFQVLTIIKVRPQLETEETIRGIGGKSGSTYIDCNFHTWLESTFGDAFKKLSRSKTGTGSKFMNDWEVVKKSFTGRDLKKKYQVPLPALGAALRERDMALASYDFEDHSVLVTGVEIVNMFEPVIEKAFAIVDEICDMLAKQELAPFRVMCLCGGLGSSEYVWARFREYVQEKLNGDCEIFADERAWSTVVRGAAIRGLSGSLVLSKRAKRAYGIGIHQAFRDGVDKEKDAFICPSKGKRADGYVYWVIEIGRKFEENMRIRTKLYYTVPKGGDEEDLIFRWKLYSCALEEAPDRKEHEDVRKEGEITLDLRNTFKRPKRNDGSNGGHEAVDIVIVFKMGNERGTIMVEALHGKKVVGTAKIDYARTHAQQIVSSSAGLLDG